MRCAHAVLPLLLLLLRLLLLRRTAPSPPAYPARPPPTAPTTTSSPPPFPKPSQHRFAARLAARLQPSRFDWGFTMGENRVTTLWQGCGRAVLTRAKSSAGMFSFTFYAVSVLENSTILKTCCRGPTAHGHHPGNSPSTDSSRHPVLYRSFVPKSTFLTELCVLRTFGGVDFSLIFICAQSVPEFLWDRLRASIQFTVIPKRAQYGRFSGEHRIPTLNVPIVPKLR
eukprot:COSAG02_NODE_350_length_24063_cov_47.131447_12_plen_226_part_00